MTRAAANALNFGAKVIYRGSLTQFHGPAKYEDLCDCYYQAGDDGFAHPERDCWGYALTLPDGQRLLHVRPESFAIDDEA